MLIQFNSNKKLSVVYYIQKWCSTDSLSYANSVSLLAVYSCGGVKSPRID